MNQRASQDLGVTVLEATVLRITGLVVTLMANLVAHRYQNQQGMVIYREQ